MIIDKYAQLTRPMFIWVANRNDFWIQIFNRKKSLQNEFLINNVWKKIRKSRFLIKTNSRNRNNEYLLSPNFGWRISLTNCSTLEPHLNFERFEAPIYIIILFCFSVSLLIKPILFYFYSYIGNFAHAITALSAPNKQANKNTNNIQMQRKKSIQ